MKTISNVLIIERINLVSKIKNLNINSYELKLKIIFFKKI